MIASDHLTTNPPIGARGLHRLLWANRGFTLDHSTGQPLDRGVAVCADPRQTWSFPFDDWDDELVASWIVGKRSRLAEGDVHLGGWLQGGWRDGRCGQVWLELVWVLPNRLRPAALAIARLHEQHAVFDLAHRELVALEPPVGRRSQL